MFMHVWFSVSMRDLYGFLSHSIFAVSRCSAPNTDEAVKKKRKANTAKDRRRAETRTKRGEREGERCSAEMKGGRYALQCKTGGGRVVHHDMMRDTFEAVHRDAGEVVGCENEAPAPRVRREARERYCSHCHRGLGAPLRQGSRRGGRGHNEQHFMAKWRTTRIAMT